MHRAAPLLFSCDDLSDGPSNEGAGPARMWLLPQQYWRTWRRQIIVGVSVFALLIRFAVTTGQDVGGNGAGSQGDNRKLITGTMTAARRMTADQGVLVGSLCSYSDRTGRKEHLREIGDPGPAFLRSSSGRLMRAQGDRTMGFDVTETMQCNRSYSFTNVSNGVLESRKMTPSGT